MRGRIPSALLLALVVATVGCVDTEPGPDAEPVESGAEDEGEDGSSDIEISQSNETIGPPPKRSLPTEGPGEPSSEATDGEAGDDEDTDRERNDTRDRDASDEPGTEARDDRDTSDGQAGDRTTDDGTADDGTTDDGETDGTDDGDDAEDADDTDDTDGSDETEETEESDSEDTNDSDDGDEDLLEDVVLGGQTLEGTGSTVVSTDTEASVGI